jgi:hypothetical protein
VRLHRTPMFCPLLSLKMRLPPLWSLIDRTRYASLAKLRPTDRTVHPLQNLLTVKCKPQGVAPISGRISIQWPAISIERPPHVAIRVGIVASPARFPFRVTRRLAIPRSNSPLIRRPCCFPRHHQSPFHATPLLTALDTRFLSVVAMGRGCSAAWGFEGPHPGVRRAPHTRRTPEVSA